MILGIHHVAIHTARFDQMVKFYRDAFGFEPSAPEVRWRGNPEIDSVIGLKGSAARVLMLKAGNCFIEMFEYFAPTDGRKEPRLRAHDRGYTHFCVSVRDIAAEYQRLKSLGMRFVHHEPVDMGEIQAVYGLDLDDNLIEIQQVAPENPMALERLAEKLPGPMPVEPPR